MIRSVLVANKDHEDNPVNRLVSSYGLRVFQAREGVDVPSADMAIMCVEHISTALAERVRLAYEGSRPIIIARGGVNVIKDQLEKVAFNDDLDRLRGEEIPNTMRLSWVVARTVPKDSSFTSGMLKERAEKLLGCQVEPYTITNFLSRCQEKGDIRKGKFRAQYLFRGLSDFFVAGMTRSNIYAAEFDTLRLEKSPPVRVVPDVSEEKVDDPLADICWPPTVPPPPELLPVNTDSKIVGLLERVDAKLAKLETFESEIREQVDRQFQLLKLTPKVSGMDSKQLGKLCTLIDVMFNYRDEPDGLSLSHSV